MNAEEGGNLGIGCAKVAELGGLATYSGLNPVGRPRERVAMELRFGPGVGCGRRISAVMRC
jgi:hypothetical protein